MNIRWLTAAALIAAASGALAQNARVDEHVAAARAAAGEELATVE